MRLIKRKLAGPAVVIAALAVIATAPAAMAGASGGKPTVEREVITETFFDDFILDICGSRPTPP